MLNPLKKSCSLAISFFHVSYGAAVSKVRCAHSSPWECWNKVIFSQLLTVEPPGTSELPLLAGTAGPDEDEGPAGRQRAPAPSFGSAE